MAGSDIFAGAEPGSPAPATALRAGSQQPTAEKAWRQEVVSRVQQHRARRRRPADPDALELDFSADSPHSFGAGQQECPMPPPPERFAEIVVTQSVARQSMVKPEPRVIRFPRPQPAYVPTIEEVRLDELELAAPAPEMPRIFEAVGPEAVGPEAVGPEAFEPEAVGSEAFEPEIFEAEPVQVSPAPVTGWEGQQMELLPSFADIQLEPEEDRIDNELDVIPMPAPLSQRAVSGVVDAGIVFIATGVFALTFVELAEEMPQSRMALVCALAAGGIFWLLFQYIFLTYRRATPGMRMAQLELCTFAGTATSMFARQCRALASTLSAVSLGLGFAWALVDEDRLGWHDRISQTYVRSLVTVPGGAFSETPKRSEGPL